MDLDGRGVRPEVAVTALNCGWRIGAGTLTGAKETQMSDHDELCAVLTSMTFHAGRVRPLQPR